MTGETKAQRKKREAWEDTVCGFLRRRYGVQPIGLDERLIGAHGAGLSPWDAADAIGRAHDLTELQSWREREK